MKLKYRPGYKNKPFPHKDDDFWYCLVDGGYLPYEIYLTEESAAAVTDAIVLLQELENRWLKDQEEEADSND